MKLIATRDFWNVPSLQISEHGGPNERHIPKGAVIEIGNAETFEKLGKVDKAAQQIVAQLVHSRCVWDAADAEVVKRVTDEIALEKKKDEAAKKLDKSAANAAAVDALTAAKGK